MTPEARVAAAIDLLDLWLGGASAEQALTGWARKNRYAGSGDRAAIRDQVFDAIRCRRSFAALGGAETGRGLMIGALKAAGRDPGEVFTGQGHAPVPLASDEGVVRAVSEAEALDCPDWLVAPLEASLGDDFARVMAALRSRAPVFLRVNLAMADVATALAALAGDGITAAAHPLSPTALEVTDGARRVAQGRAYQDGLVELQDAASQAVVDLLAVTPGLRVLDYCAGGGGKSLALAAQGAVVYAHDSAPRRMADLPARAERAGVRIEILAPGAAAGIARGGHDLVLVDAPCSGSGAWRRSPQGKWDLTPERLDELCRIQAGILDETAPLVAVGGGLAYVTCSLLAVENQAQITAFHRRHEGWKTIAQRQFTPLDGGDGFFVAHLTRFDKCK